MYIIGHWLEGGGGAAVAQIVVEHTSFGAFSVTIKIPRMHFWWSVRLQRLSLAHV